MFRIRVAIRSSPRICVRVPHTADNFADRNRFIRRERGALEPGARTSRAGHFAEKRKTGEDMSESSDLDGRSVRAPIFVISLPGSQNRRETISKRLAELNLPFEFFDAVNGRELPESLAHLLDHEHKVARSLYGSPLLPGEVGCALSHALLYKKILDEGLEAAYVLEDDSYPTDEFASLVHENALGRQDHIELVTFFYFPLYAWPWMKRTVSPRVSLRRPMQDFCCCAAYYLTASTARKLLEAALPISTVADWPAPIHRWSNVYCCHPRLVYPDSRTDQSLIVTQADAVLAQRRLHRLAQNGSMSRWHPVPRALARLLSFTLLPCWLCPSIFGSVTNATEFLRAKLLPRVGDYLD